MCCESQGRVSRRAAVALLTAAPFVCLVPSARADKLYVVRKNDTLSEIARTHGVSVRQLAAHNRLSRPDDIKVGQRLRIPTEPHVPQLPAALKREMDGTRLKSGRWKYIVLHHSATPKDSAKGMDRYHTKERGMENGLAYHFVIGNGHGMEDGEIAVGRRWKEPLNGGHLASEFLNARALGICLVGNFEETRPTARQMESLHALSAYLLNRCKLPVSAVRTHQKINTVYTKCPGKHFPMATLEKLLKESTED
jgi:LysM repeat protein